MNTLRNKVKPIILFGVLSLSVTLSYALNKPTKLYVYGFAATFNDSTVYFTNIEEIDTAWVDTKSKFLYSRDNYSYQFRDYLKSQGVGHPTCITGYATSRKVAEKKYTSLKRRYTSKGNYNIKYVTESEFRYNSISPDESEMKLIPVKDRKSHDGKKRKK